MSEIFISYSRKDVRKALSLAESLRAEGMSVWIDQSGIGGAEQWATEIARSIRNCDALVLLLSHDSVASENVLKEVSLAHEKGKRICPVEVTASVALTTEFEVALLGRSKLAYGDTEGLVRAIQGTTPHAAIHLDPRKSLVILPFRDRSADEDNQWFADGIVSELATMLSGLGSLRLVDVKAARSYSTTTLTNREVAQELGVRFFIEGAVNKSGDEIKIATGLIDTTTGDTVWEDLHTGGFEDIFEIQETVATKVIEGLKLRLTAEEARKIAERETGNAEAYELYLRACSLFDRQTKESNLHAVAILEEVLKLDPNYKHVLQEKAVYHLEIYRSYERLPSHLEEVQRLLDRALELKPDFWSAYAALSELRRLQGDLHEAEWAAKTFVEKAPDDFTSHFQLGFFYMETDQPAKAIAPFERVIELYPTFRLALWNLVLVADRAGDLERVRKWSRHGIPIFENKLRSFPDDDHSRVMYANLLKLAGRREDAIRSIEPLTNKPNMDATALYNLACMYSNFDDQTNSLAFFRRSIEAGFAHRELIESDPDLDCIRGLPEFNEIVSRVSTTSNDHG